jgi:hypothetical protein
MRWRVESRVKFTADATVFDAFEHPIDATGELAKGDWLWQSTRFMFR